MSIIKVLGRISGSLIVLLFTASALSQEVRQDPRAQVFSDGFPYESKFIQINAQQMHYIDKGEGKSSCSCTVIPLRVIFGVM